ncbi:MAG: isochorismatase family protein [Calditrichia bacterium]
MKTTRMMKLFFTALFTIVFTVSAFAQNPDANFVPKNSKTDNLLTGDNTVLLVIDWQQDLINVVQNIDQDVMMNNIQAMVKTANLFNVPVIETTIGVKMAGSTPTVESVKTLINRDVENIDRVSLNAWQNKALVAAVRKTGRTKILITGLWTSGCPTYTTLDALKDEYEVYILVDLMGDATTMAHNTAIDRMIQAGAIPFTWEGAGAEMLRSYTNPKAFTDEDIKGGFVEIMKQHFYPFAGKY